MALLRVFCWALIFITRLRFPPGESLANVLKRCYNNESLADFRRFQRTERKLGKAKLDLTFLTKCKIHGVIPRFLRFKVANCQLRNSFTYQQCQKKLLDEEIRIKNARIRTLKDELLDANSSLRSHVSYLDILHLKSVSDRENTIYLKRHSATQNK